MGLSCATALRAAIASTMNMRIVAIFITRLIVPDRESPRHLFRARHDGYPRMSMTESATADDPGYKWRLAGFLFFASALNYGDRTAITALFPLLQKEFHLS